MRRIALPPPRTLRAEVGVETAGPPLGRRRDSLAARTGALTRDRLAGPAPACERSRRWFHPRRGRLRRLERWGAQWLAAHLYPRVPGIQLPYGASLRRGLTLSEAEVRLPGLAAAFDGLRLLLITDVHAGPFVAPRRLAQVFDRLLETDPDVVLIGGDVVSARIDDYLEARPAFRRLNAPLGVYAVLGNHDHYTGRPDLLIELLEADGIDVLHNRSTRLRHRGAALTLAGVDDLLVGAPDLDAALPDATSPSVLLSHNPDLFFEAARRGVSLTLSGHTHAGQIRIPGLPVLVRQSRYRLDEGRYTLADSQLIVSRGLGAVGIPLRLCCSPEAVLVRLTAKSS